MRQVRTSHSNGRHTITALRDGKVTAEITTSDIREYREVMKKIAPFIGVQTCIERSGQYFYYKVRA